MPYDLGTSVLGIYSMKTYMGKNMGNRSYRNFEALVFIKNNKTGNYLEVY